VVPSPEGDSKFWFRFPSADALGYQLAPLRGWDSNALLKLTEAAKTRSLFSGQHTAEALLYEIS
jgi:hypothetical protein